jgi:hypothetical protein
LEKQLRKSLLYFPSEALKTQLQICVAFVLRTLSGRKAHKKRFDLLFKCCMKNSVENNYLKRIIRSLKPLNLNIDGKNDRADKISTVNHYLHKLKL